MAEVGLSFFQVGQGLEVDVCIFEGVFQLRVARIVRRHRQRSSVSEYHGSRELRVRVDLTIDTVSNSKIGAGTAERNIFTALQGNTPRHRCNKDGTVDTLSDLQAVHICSNVDVGVLTTYYPYVSARGCISHILDSHALIEECYVFWLVKLALLACEVPTL